MKGTPSFSRPTAERCIKSASSAGLGPVLRKALKTPLLAVQPLTIVKTASTVWLIVRANKGLLLGFRLFDEPNGFPVAAAHARGKRESVVGASGTGVPPKTLSPYLLPIC